MHACIQFPFNHFFPFLSIRRSGGGRDEYRHSQHRHGIRSKHGMLHVTVFHYVSKCNALCTLTWGAPADVALTHTMIRCEASEVHWHAAVSALHFAADIWIQNTRALAHSHAHPHALLMSHAVFYVPPRNEHVRGCTFPLWVGFNRKSSSRWALPSQGERRRVPRTLTESRVSLSTERGFGRCTTINSIYRRFHRCIFFLKMLRWKTVMQSNILLMGTVKKLISRERTLCRTRRAAQL